ncbi:MAG: SPFH domain-containing protein [Oscillospiraceae bacterium]|nr:SPFH domain-containing protein [Oscillospiraceae bacterium]
MSKFVIECPRCGRYAEAKTGFFARKKIECACGNVIDVRTDKLSSRECPHCGNNVVFDQSKGDKALCPVCHEPINTTAEQDKTVEFSCAQCGVRLRTAKGVSTYTCPVCDCVNDVAERAEKEKITHDGLASIIKYEGDNSTFIWKHPIEDFNYGSQLIVHESQEAVFFRDGQALDSFGPGRYTLETQQLPMLEKLYKLPTDTEGTFHSEIYFINKTVQMAIKWGTPDKVRFIDPLTGTPLELGASGEMNLAVDDGRKLLIKVVGTMKGVAWEEGPGFTKSLQASFRPMIASAVKTNIPTAIKANEIDILEIDEKLDLISAALIEKIRPGFEEYGLTIPQFYVTQVVLPEDDPNFKRIRELHTIVLQSKVYQAEATVKTVQAQAEAQYRTAQERSKAEIEAAHRGVVLEQQTTETEVARREAERKIIAAQAEAQAQRMQGLTEAEIMAAKGYSQKDVLQAEVQKAYAEGLGNMGPKSVSGGGGGGIIGDVMGLGVGMAAAQAVMPQLGNMFQGMNPQQPALDSPTVGADAHIGPSAAVPAGWDCPACGAKNITSKFCPDCGAKKPDPKPADTWDCPACGAKGIMSRFCPDCGAKRPEAPKGWTCPECGKTDILSKFCPECGHKKEE